MTDQFRANLEKLVENLDEDPQVIDGIRRGLADMKAGRSIPLSEFDSQFRAQYNIPADARSV